MTQRCDKPLSNKKKIAVKWFGAASLAVLLAFILYPWPNTSLPTFKQVRHNFTASESRLLDRNGELLQRLRTNPQIRRGQWLALADLSPALQNAILFSEDKRFYQHSGIDWLALVRAAWDNIWHGRRRGASTISMQLVGLLDPDLQRSTGGRSLLQKIKQAAAARKLENKWHKNEILEAYLNLAPYRGEIVGIDALSHAFFNKAAHGLNEHEAAIAAALIRAPNANPRTIAKRACKVLRSMQHSAANTPCRDDFMLWASERIRHKTWSPNDGIAPHLAQRLLTKQAAGSTLRSTILAALQRQAIQALQRQLHELAPHHVQDGAVLVLDNASGDVLAWVGTSATTSSAPAVDMVTSPRQSGSTLKPFLYARAIAENRLTAASLLDDSPTAIATASGLYIPQNYDRRFKGWVSVRRALAASLNIPAIRAIAMLGVNRFAQQLQQLGISLPHKGEYYGYSLALGSAEVSLLELTNAYRALANGGQFSAIRTRLSAPPSTAPTHALDPRASFIVSHILSDNNARLTTFGANSLLQTPFWTAVKTGTSKDMRDNWAVGYSQRYTVGVWVGNAAGEAMWDVSGMSGAAPIWAEIMQYLHAHTPSQAPLPPAGVIAQAVHFNTKERNTISEPVRTEWFISGTEQAQFIPPATNSSPRARIESPINGTIVAIDPDIPPQHQRLMLRTRARHLQWWIDDQKIGSGTTLSWPLWPGQHRIELRARNNHILDTVKIEIRGAQIQPQNQLKPPSKLK